MEISKQIFLVEDTRDLAFILQRWLVRAGYEVRIFNDGESAVYGLTKALPDLVLLDLGLPGMDGIEVLKKIQQLSPGLPVVVLTAESVIESVVKAMQLGAKDYLVKPTEETRLLTTLNNAIHSSELNRRVRSCCME